MSEPNAEHAEAVAVTVDRLLAKQEWPRVITLRHPIEFGKGESIQSLEFRRGKMGDLDGMSVEAMPPVNQLLMIASRMCGKPVAALKMLDEEDCAAVLEIAVGFFGRCLMGGKTP